MNTNQEAGAGMTGHHRLNMRFIQKIINVSFLLLLGGILSASLSNTLGNSTPGMQTSSAIGIEPYLGEIAIYPYSFAPQGWARCDGQILAIASNTALFSLIGTTYGGDGQTTFALPDLRGRVVVHNGSGPGLPNYFLGEVGGQTTGTLTVANLPPHSHTASGTVRPRAKQGQGDDSNPRGRYPASAATDLYADSFNDSLGISPLKLTINNTGSGTPFSNMQPYLGVGYYIAVQGIYPTQ
jgi:microcystin-dependent protein